MLSEEKIKKMIRLSDYENGQGSTDLKCIRYLKMDYVRLQVLKSVLSVVIAGFLILALVAVYNLEYILKNALALPWETIALYGGTALLIVCILSVIVTCRMASRKYEESGIRAREYYSTLQELLDLYEKEEQGQEGGHI